jgi:hypothetical protein
MFQKTNRQPNQKMEHLIQIRCFIFLNVFFFFLAFTHDTHWSHEKNSKQVSTFKKAFWPQAVLELGPYSTPPYTSPYSSKLPTFMLCNFA